MEIALSCQDCDLISSGMVNKNTLFFLMLNMGRDKGWFNDFIALPIACTVQRYNACVV